MPTSKIYGHDEFTSPQRLLPLGFYFRVVLNWVEYEKGKKKEQQIECSFQSVSGLTKEIVTESFREGGQMYDYALPTKVQYAELVLKRGLWVPAPDTADKGLEYWQKWFSRMTIDLKVQTMDLLIQLMRPTNGTPVPYLSWNVRRAWPKKWVIADFNAEENQVVIETIELHYDEFVVVANEMLFQLE